MNMLSSNKCLGFSDMMDVRPDKVIDPMITDPKSSSSSSAPEGGGFSRASEGELHFSDKGKRIIRILTNYLESKTVSVEWQRILSLINFYQAQLVSEMCQNKNSDRLLEEVSEKLQNDARASLKKMCVTKKPLKFLASTQNICRSIKSIQDQLVEYRAEYNKALGLYLEAFTESKDCLETLKIKASNAGDVAKRVEKLINTYAELFFYDSVKARLIDVREIGILRANLAELKARLSTVKMQPKQAKILKDLFQQIFEDKLSKAIEKLPRALKVEVRKAFSNPTDDIKKSIDHIRHLSIAPKMAFDLLAAWIDGNKIPWNLVASGLTHQEAFEIASRITQLDLTDLSDQWDDAQLAAFVQRFSKIKHAYKQPSL